MLEQIFKYHQQLVSDEFVENLLKQIDKRQQFRMLILGLFGCLGLIAAFSALGGLVESSWYASLVSLLTDTKLMLGAGFSALIIFTLFALWFSYEQEGFY